MCRTKFDYRTKRMREMIRTMKSDKTVFPRLSCTDVPPITLSMEDMQLLLDRYEKKLEVV